MSSTARDGRSRQFGFVGFPSVEQAEQAITYFNNSYVDTARIQVKVRKCEGALFCNFLGEPATNWLCAFQFAEQAQSTSLGRPWSQHSQGGFLTWKMFAVCCLQGGRMRNAQPALVWQGAQLSRRSIRRSRTRSQRSESSSSRRGEDTSSPTLPKVDLLLPAQSGAMQQPKRACTIHAGIGWDNGSSVQLPASLPTVHSPMSLR